MQTPIEMFLEECYQEIKSDDSGRAADYIPELSKVDPDKFSISLATLDGHVYNIGDFQSLFTIQSISKAFVFAFALETLGCEKVESVISVEPSGEAFNSIRLTADNKPFNPMVNAGAIACSGLIVSDKGNEAYECIRNIISRFCGREVEIDHSVYHSESLTGDRNRAIAWLLRNYDRLPENVENVVDVYFKQCSLLVNSKDLAIMAATLANGGVNPVTQQRVVSEHVSARTLSVMTSSGMYDYAGQWIYRVGIPAKSGVGGGIIASLPAVMGLGTFSPRLDSYGNSVRGIKVCEKISSYFNLHVLSRKNDIRSCILADYTLKGISSRRVRLMDDVARLEKDSHKARIIELVGALSFSSLDYLSRSIVNQNDHIQYLIVDLTRVPEISFAAAKLLRQLCLHIQMNNVKFIISGASGDVTKAINDDSQTHNLCAGDFRLLDQAIEYVENDILGYHADQPGSIPLRQQFILSEFSDAEISDLEKICVEHYYKSGEKICSIGDPADSMFFVMTGSVSVKLPGGVTLSSLSAGMSFGELCLIENARSAEVWADTEVKCLQLKLDIYASFCETHHGCGEKLLLNGARLLTQRLRLANSKVNNLTISR